MFSEDTPVVMLTAADVAAIVRRELTARGSAAPDRLLLSVEETAEQLGVKRDAVYRILAREPQLRVKIGSRTLVHWPRLRMWVEDRQGRPADEAPKRRGRRRTA